MEGNMILLLPMVLPILAGVVVLAGKVFRENRKYLTGLSVAVLVLELVLTFQALVSGGSLTMIRLTDQLTLELHIDQVSRLFAALTAAVWLLVGIYSVSYMSHEEEEHRFFGYYLIVAGVLMGLNFSANLITLYVFYELMTLTSLPLVLHERSREAVRAGLKYLFYSVAGAFLALFGIFFLAGVSENLTFTAGGVLSDSALAGKEGLLLTSAFCMIVGFGTKAGMFPLHGWLPTAHPVAPASASAVLSGLITKAGVLAIIRVVYYVIGPDRLRGTWVQNVWILLTLLTVFMGSMLAYKEPVMKKRLAYSTVSQVSYVLFGLSLLNPTAFAGALSHVVFHSVIKHALFLTAGAIIVTTGWTRVEQMRGLGQVMPKTLACYTVAALALVGIPPLSGFVSKWYLASGALSSGTGVWAWVGPAVLLVSALLTAGYLLPLTIQGFFPGHDFKGEEIEKRGLKGKEPSWWMLAPIGVLVVAVLLLGCFPGSLISMLQSIAASVL